MKFFSQRPPTPFRPPKTDFPKIVHFTFCFKIVQILSENSAIPHLEINLTILSTKLILRMIHTIPSRSDPDQYFSFFSTIRFPLSPNLFGDGNIYSKDEKTLIFEKQPFRVPINQTQINLLQICLFCC